MIVAAHGRIPTAWTPAHLNALQSIRSDDSHVPLSALERAVPGLYLWDPIPVIDCNGATARLDGEEMWLALAAPTHRMRDDRHDVARIHLLSSDERGWRDRGPLMPGGFSAGSREWSGSAVFDASRRMLQVFYTASGQRNESPLTYEQRIFVATARMQQQSSWHFSDWSEHREIFAADGKHYRPAQDKIAKPGFLTAFRDPSWFRDPGTGEEMMVFAASSASTQDPFNGAIGLASRLGESWRLEAPLVTASGVNTELELPHIVWRDGLYYLFWSTQAHTFHPAVAGVTGLYGMIGSTLRGPYEPLNGSGLVLRDPPHLPAQTYGWHVTNELTIVSFVDQVATARGVDFLGTIAPRLTLELRGSHARLRPTPN